MKTHETKDGRKGQASHQAKQHVKFDSTWVAVCFNCVDQDEEHGVDTRMLERLHFLQSAPMLQSCFLNS